jgi:hypothetical protein
LVPPNVALIGRRLFGKYIAPHADHLQKRLLEIELGDYTQTINELKGLPLAELKQRYNARQIEA